jgi:diguanylate cyclase (GGDEF)-like protein/PAS domain S-box-containing protein
MPLLSAHSGRTAAARATVVGVVAVLLGATIVGAGSGWLPLMANLASLAAAALAAAGCTRAALRSDGRARRAWAALAASTGVWALGRLVWTVSEHALDRPLPLPSVADAGFLAALPLATAALVLAWPGEAAPSGRARRAIDVAIVVTALLLTSWLLVLAPVLRDAGGQGLATALALAYPVGGVALVTLVAAVLLAEGRLRGGVLPLHVIGAGLVAVSVAGSGFAHLASAGRYATGHPIDVAWVLGFLLIGVASLRPGDVRAVEGATPLRERVEVLIPYAAVVIALCAAIAEHAHVGELSPVAVWALCALVALLVVRQTVVLVDNADLALSLQQGMAELSASERRLQALVRHSSDIVAVVDREGVVRYVGESVERILGHQTGSLLRRTLGWVLEPGSVHELRGALAAVTPRPFETTTIGLTLRDAEGRDRPFEATVTNLLTEPSVEGLVLNLRDVTEQRTLQEQLRYEASHDALTALANRTLLTERATAALERAKRTGHDLAVLFLDLDGFKEVNDSLGHAAGDSLLTIAAQRLRRCVRPGDTVARLGGDEFAVLIEDIDDLTGATTVAARICESLQQPFALGPHRVTVTASLGIALTREGTGTSEDLLRNADLAMYRAKADHPGRWQVFDRAMHTALLSRLELEADLVRALERNELVLHYQPKFDLRTGAIAGAEALVRWQHPTRGLLGPGAFVPTAERTGLIVPMGTWVLRRACRQAMSWQQQRGGAPLAMAVNVAGLQVDATLPDTVAAALEETGMPAEQLVLEMTESMLLETDEVVEVLDRLKQLGVRLAIDDFGTGYSSLSYLHRFPADLLKIDRSFVSRMRGSADARSMVAAIVQLARSLSLATVAEGIEHEEELALLDEMGCTYAQGFLLARPAPPMQIGDLLGVGVRPEVLAALPRGHGRPAADAV